MRNTKDIRTLLFLLIILSVRIGLWCYEPNYMIIWLPCLVALVFILYSIKHNHLHFPMFKSVLLNRIYENILGIFTGTSMKGAQVIHLVNHHKENNNDMDWGNTYLYQSKSEAVNLLKYAFTIPLKFLRAKQKWLQNTSNKSIGVFANVEGWVILFVYVMLLILKLDATLKYIILPHLIGQLILVSFNYFQHAGCYPSSNYNHSRNFTGKLINFLTFNNGYHTAHHLFPAAHWSEYSEIHLSIQNKIAPHLNEHNFFRYFVRLLFSKNKKTTMSEVKGVIHESKNFQ